MVVRLNPLSGLAFATSNPHKLREYAEIFGASISVCELVIPDCEPPETLRLTANRGYRELCELVAARKAEAAYRLNGNVQVVIETTLLFIDALQGFPGLQIKDMDTPVAREILAKHTYASRSFESPTATAVSTMATYSENHGVQLRSGLVEGVIADLPAPEETFDWDTIFIPHGSARPFSKMNRQEKNALSMRRLVANAVLAEPFLIG